MLKKVICVAVLGASLLLIPKLLTPTLLDLYPDLSESPAQAGNDCK